MLERLALVICTTYTAVTVEGIIEKGFLLAVMCKPAAGAELQVVNTAAAPKTPHIRALRQQTCTAVLATTGIDLLNCRPPAVAHTTSYC